MQKGCLIRLFFSLIKSYDRRVLFLFCYYGRMLETHVLPVTITTASLFFAFKRSLSYFYISQFSFCQFLLVTVACINNVLCALLL